MSSSHPLLVPVKAQNPIRRFGYGMYDMSRLLLHCWVGTRHGKAVRRQL
jgi:hypothetical protein